MPGLKHSQHLGVWTGSRLSLSSVSASVALYLPPDLTGRDVPTQPVKCPKSQKPTMTPKRRMCTPRT